MTPAEKAAKDEARREKQAAADAASESAKAQRAADRQTKAAMAAQKSYEAIRANLLKLAASYAGKAGLSAIEASDAVNGLFDRLTAIRNKTNDTAFKIVAASIDLVKNADSPPLWTIADGLIAGVGKAANKP